MVQETVEAPLVREFTDDQADFLTPGEVLDALARITVSALCGATAGVSLLDRGQLRYITALSLAATDLECVQERDQAGPGVDAAHDGVPIAVSDLRAPSRRWPRYQQRLVGHGLACVTAIPMAVDRTVLGTLSVYGSSPRGWSSGDHSVARRLIHTAMVRLRLAHSGVPPHDVWQTIVTAIAVADGL